MECRIKLFLPQPQCVISQSCLLIFPGCTPFLPFITPLKLIVCKRFGCVSVLVVALRSSQANRVCNTVGKTGGFCLLSSCTAFFRCSIDPCLPLSHTLGPFPITTAAVCVPASVWVRSVCPPLVCILLHWNTFRKSAQHVKADLNTWNVCILRGNLTVRAHDRASDCGAKLRGHGFASPDSLSKSNR